MGKMVNSSTFKNTGKKNNKKNPWIPLIIIVVLALLLVMVNYIMLDLIGAAY